MYRCVEHIICNSGIAKDDYEINARHDEKRIGCPKMVDALTNVSSGEFVCFLGDDTLPQKDWLKYALEDMEKLPGGWGLVGLNDNTGRILPCHWLASTKLLPLLGGEFFHTGYKHCYCDNELMKRCEDMGRFTYSDKAIVEHDHPILRGNRERDEFYTWAYSKEVITHDHKLYFDREKKGWK